VSVARVTHEDEASGDGQQELPLPTPPLTGNRREVAAHGRGARARPSLRAASLIHSPRIVRRVRLDTRECRLLRQQTA